MLRHHSEYLAVETSEKIQFIDITDLLQQAIQRMKFVDGLLCAYNMHTTSGLWVNEHERGLLEDMKKKLQIFASDTEYYKHDDLRIRTENLEPRGMERKNAQSHLRSTFFSTSVSIPVHASKLELGRWQSVLYAELDGPQQRKVQLVMTGTFED